MEKIKIFISYAKSDFKLVKSIIDDLEKSPQFQNNGERYEYVFWWDHHMIQSEEWRKQIINNIKFCDIFVCMLSESSIESEFIKNVEFPLAFERRESAGISILGILLYECSFQKLDIRKLEIIPKEYGRLKPFNQWENRKEVIKFIKEGLKAATISSLLNLPGPLKDVRFFLSNQDKSNHAKQFLSLKEINRIKTKNNIINKIHEDEEKRNTVKVKLKWPQDVKSKIFYWFLIIVAIIIIWKKIVG